MNPEAAVDEDEDEDGDESFEEHHPGDAFTATSGVTVHYQALAAAATAVQVAQSTAGSSSTPQHALTTAPSFNGGGTAAAAAPSEAATDVTQHGSLSDVEAVPASSDVEVVPASIATIGEEESHTFGGGVVGDEEEEMEEIMMAANGAGPSSHHSHNLLPPQLQLLDSSSAQATSSVLAETVASSAAITGPDPLSNPWGAAPNSPSSPSSMLQQDAAMLAHASASTASLRPDGSLAAPGPAAHVPSVSARHVLYPLLRSGCPGAVARRLTHLTVREEIPSNTSNEDGASLSHPESCLLGAVTAALLARRLCSLVHLEWQGLLVAPHASSLSPLAGLTSLRSLTLSVNQDDPVARIGLHCLPSTLTTLTLQVRQLMPKALLTPLANCLI